MTDTQTDSSKQKTKKKKHKRGKEKERTRERETEREIKHTMLPVGKIQSRTITLRQYTELPECLTLSVLDMD